MEDKKHYNIIKKHLNIMTVTWGMLAVMWLWFAIITPTPFKYFDYFMVGLAIGMIINMKQQKWELEHRRIIWGLIELSNKTKAITKIEPETHMKKVTNNAFNLPPTYGKIEVYQDKSKQWGFRLRSNNGNIIVGSEVYKSRTGAMKGLAALKRIANEGELID